jgi:glycosyltransferase involved in cell wall biosynthesis
MSNLLWIKVGGLWPLNTGGRLRSFHILAELSRTHRVTLLTTHGPDDDPEGLAAALPHAARVISVPHRIPKQGSGRFVAAVARSWLSPQPVDIWKCAAPAVRRHAAQMIGAGGVDLCVADFLAAVPNVPRAPRVPVVLFAHNVEHRIWQRLTCVEPRVWRRLPLEIEWRKMRRYEARACAWADLTLAVSDVDRAALSALAPAARVDAIPTGVDTTYFAPNARHEHPARLVFTGSMDWYPNEDAMLHFIETVLPRVRARVPGATLTIVGRRPAAHLRAVARAAGSVEVTGTVDDVRPFVAEAAVYVVPLRIGGGTRLKIFEALAMGKAVVSTTIGAEGLPLVPAEHFIQADDPVAFADAVAALLASPDRRQALGARGRALVEEKYSWPQVAREFAGRCEEVLDHAR